MLLKSIFDVILSCTYLPQITSLKGLLFLLQVHLETLSSGPQPLFSQEQEAHLVEHIKKMAKLGYGYTRTEVTSLATDFAVDLDLKKKSDKPLSLQWFRSFMDRWPELKAQRPRALAMSRAKNTSEEVVNTYFTELENILTKYNLVDKPQCIYNIDEKGVSPEHNPPKVVGGADAQPPAVTSERDHTTTIIGAGNAMGTQIPPFLVFAGHRMRQELLQGCTPGTTGDVSPTGWSNSDIFKTYLEDHFINYVQGLSEEQPIIILYDGHKSHVSLGVIDWAKAHNIILFVLPAHTSHLLQPLDVGCFGPLSKILSNSCHKYMRENHCKITRYNIGELCTNAYVKALSPDNLKSSFRRTGIYPLNKAPYPSQVYLPATVYRETSEPDGHALDTNNNTDGHDDSTVPQSPEQTDMNDISSPMDVTPDVTQVPIETPRNLSADILTQALVDSPPMDLSPDIVTQAPVDSPPMDLSPDIVTQAPVNFPPIELSPDPWRFLDDSDFDMDDGDTTDTIHDNDLIFDGQETDKDRHVDKTITDSPVLCTFFNGREQSMLNRNEPKNNRKYLSKIVSGKAITEESVIESIKEHCQSKKCTEKGSKNTSSKTVNKQKKGKDSIEKSNDRQKKGKGSTTEKSNHKQKGKGNISEKSNARQKGKGESSTRIAEKSSDGQKSGTGSSKLKKEKCVDTKQKKTNHDLSPKPGPSGLQVIYISDSDDESLYDHESQMSESDLCCVCNKFYPEQLRQCGDLTIAKWGQCDYNGCLHWVHLRFCCEVRVLRTHHIFYCPCHGLPCLQEE